MELMMRFKLGVLGALVLAGAAYGQEGGLPTRVNGGGTVPISAKRPLKHSDYATWKSVAGAQLSADGLWTSYAINPAEGDGELFFKKLDGSATWKVERGGGVRFSPDSRFALITIAPKFADAEAARKAKREAPKSSTALVELTTGKVETLEKIRRAAFPEEGGSWLALHTEVPPVTPTPPANPPAPGRTDQQRQGPPGRRPGGGGAPGGPAGAPGTAATPRQGGSELTLRPLGGGAAATVADVASFQFDQKGKRLLYVVDSKEDAKDGLYARVLATGETTPIATGPGEVSAVTLDEAGEQVAFLRKPPAPARGQQQPAAETPAPGSKLFLWHTGDAKPREVGQVSENAPPRFAKDGSFLLFGIAPTAKPKPKDAPEPINVDIWSTRDGLIQTQQKIQLTAEQRRTFTNIYWIKNQKSIALADDKLRDVSVGAESKRLVLGSDPLPYLAEVAYDTGYRDYSLVDITTGTRKPIRTHHSGSISLSPDEKWLLWWDSEKRSWWVQDPEGKLQPRDLTGAIKVRFDEEDWDSPAAPSSYGMAGWTAGDKRVVFYDRFDLWAIDPATGQAERLTQGRERGITFRYNRMDPEERQIPEGKPLLLSSVDDATKAMGWWQRASLSNPALTKFAVYDGFLGGLQKAKNADTILFTKERFEVFPDLWTAASVAKAEQATRLTDANPQQSGINWGRSERILYRTGWGRELPAILTVPENFDPNKKYPVMVYIYEKLTQGLHRYVRPAPGTSINVSRYVSNGYIVLQPDIEYKEGYPGESALMCVVPAVQELLRRGYVDEKRIGLQGHSWGAYQTTYLITRTNLFRAVEAGASVSNMFSAYGGIRYESGMSRQFQYEKTQSRIGATPWQKPLAYLENSPIFWADKVETPYLTIHNDNDGAVPWTQGIEFFMALKRMNKEAYLFNYNGEGHGLTNRDNTKHWTVHMAEFFDHYLLGAPRPEWMDKGVPYSERGTRDLREIYR